MRGSDDFRHRHFVARQRSRFVGANDRDRTERLDTGQMADKRVAFHHPLQAERERDGHDRGQTFRHRRNRQAHGEEKSIRETLAPPKLQDENERDEREAGKDQDAP